MFTSDIPSYMCTLQAEHWRQSKERKDVDQDQSGAEKTDKDK